MASDSAPVPSSRSLVSKLAEVMAAVERVPKRGRNTFHNYDYATEADIVSVVRQELASRNVMLIPHIDQCIRIDLPPKAGKDRDPVTDVAMVFTFLDGESGESIAKCWRGTGQDGGDKGLYKAITGAEKYFLLKTFLIPTGDDPERDDKAQLKDRDRATVKPDKTTRAARTLSPEAAAAGAVFVSKVIPKTSGNREWAEIIFSTGESVIAREPGAISLAMNLAQETSPVILMTHVNAKGHIELDGLERWQSSEARDTARDNAALDAEIAAKDRAF